MIKTIIDISSHERILILPLGGHTLKDWVFNDYLKRLSVTEIHIYDRGPDQPPKFQDAAKAVNDRADNSKAFLTRKNEIENYIHPAAIKSIRNLNVVIEDDTDVPALVARLIHEATAGVSPWDNLNDKKKSEKMRNAKIWLNKDAARSMTYEQIIEADKYGEILNWHQEIKRALDN